MKTEDIETTKETTQRNIVNRETLGHFLPNTGTQMSIALLMQEIFYM